MAKDSSKESVQILEKITKIGSLAKSSIEMGVGALSNLANGILTCVSYFNDMYASTSLIEAGCTNMTNTFQSQAQILQESAAILGLSIFQSFQEPLTDMAVVGVNAIAQLQSGFEEGGMEGLMSIGGSVLTNIIMGINEALPQLIEIAIMLIQCLVQSLGEQAGMIGLGAMQIVTTLIEGIVVALPMLMDLALQLIVALVNGLTLQLPLLMQMAMTLITTLLSVIVENLPMIVDAGIRLLAAFLQGIVDTVPQLLAYLPVLMNSIMTILEEQLPIIIDTGMHLLFSLLNGIIQAVPQLFAYLPTLIENVVTILKEQLPSIVDTGVRLLFSLLNGIMQTLPQIGESLPAIITTIIDTLVENLPQIIDTGIQILLKLLDGIVDSLPMIGYQAGKIITTLITTLVNKLPDILRSGGQIIGSLLSGLIRAIPNLMAAIPGLISGIVRAFMEIDWPSVGINIIKGIISGLFNMGGAFLDAIGRLAKQALNSILSFFGICSPSKVMRDEVGKFLPLGMAEGVKKAIPTSNRTIVASLQDSFDVVKNVAKSYSLGDTMMASTAKLQANATVSSQPIKLELEDNRNMSATLVLENGAEVARWLAPFMDNELAFIK